MSKETAPKRVHDPMDAALVNSYLRSLANRHQPDGQSGAVPPMSMPGPVDFNPWREVKRCMDEYDRYQGKCTEMLCSPWFDPNDPEYCAASVTQAWAAAQCMGWLRVIERDIAEGVVR